MSTMKPTPRDLMTEALLAADCQWNFVSIRQALDAVDASLCSRQALERALHEPMRLFLRRPDVTLNELVTCMEQAILEIQPFLRLNDKAAKTCARLLWENNTVGPHAVKRPARRSKTEANPGLVLFLDFDGVLHPEFPWRKAVMVHRGLFEQANHEFYGQTHEKTLASMRQEAKQCGVHFLERDAVEIDGYRFLGATLWTDFDVFGEDKREKSMGESMLCINDFRVISTERPRTNYHPNQQAMRLFSPEDAREIHQETVAWLEAELPRRDPAKTIVVSHHSPNRNSVLPKYAADLTTGAFASDLTRLMGRARLWIHGHMHNASDYEVNGTRVVANPRGYVLADDSNENPQFKPDLVIEV